MKQKLSLSILVSFILFSFLMVGCKSNPTNNNNPTDSSSCGSPTELNYFYILADLQTSFPPSYLESGQRTYILYKDADSICTDLHITGSFKAQMLIDSGAVFSIEAAIKWNILWEARTNGGSVYTSSVMKWEGEIPNVGLKQVFGENAGLVTAYIYISFPTRGSEALDSAFLMAKFINAEIKIPYRWHKPENLSDVITPASYKDFIFAEQPDRNLYREVIKLPNSRNKTVIINRNYSM